MMDLYKRTLENCKFYEAEKDNLHLLSEIGCLRGIAYCIEKTGFDPLQLEGLEYFINKSNDLMQK